MKSIELDVHTHTLASGHAYGTITEMAQEAAARGLRLLGITEHARGIPGTCDDIYFMNLRVLPRTLFGIEVLFGSEINILDYDGTLSMADKLIDQLDIRIAGIHSPCYTFGSVAQNTAAVLSAIRNPRIDIISHPDDGACPLDYELIARAAKEHHTLLEINNNSLRSSYRLNVTENAAAILKWCKHYETPVLVSSDAHYMNDIANLDHVFPLLERTQFPEELVINTSVERFKAFIQQNR